MLLAQDSVTENLRTTISEEFGIAPTKTLGEILSELLPYLYILGGFILLIMIVWAGFEILLGAGDQKSLEAGKQRLGAALIGFSLLFVSYWLVQLLQILFDIKILG